MTIGFRATTEDRQRLAKLTHEGESTTEVLRRALAALEQLEWEREAQTEARAIMISGENLGDEPDAW